MKTTHSVNWMLLGALLLPALTGCSMFGGESSEEVAAEGEGTEEAAAEENAGTENAEAAVEGAEANAAPDALAGAESGIPLEGVDNTATSEIPPELLANGGNPLAGAEGVPAGGAMPGAALPAPQAAMPAAPGDARVYYVSSDKADLMNGPSNGAQAVGALKKGDPVLVKVEGNWAQVVNRGWVPLNVLSMSPVGRAKAAKAWN